MANNLFISYDLNNPGQNYEEVIETIKSLGNWAHVQRSYWYVSSQYSAAQAADYVWSRMDRNDSLTVVDASNDIVAWYGLPPEVENQIQQHWKRRVI